jgi:nicotinamide mononucleotide transporter
MTDTILEWTGALTGLASVVLTVKRRVACWPVGLVSVAAYALFFFRLKLYADTGLQVFFFATSLYGWWHWARGGALHTAAPILVLSARRRMLTAMVLAVVVAVVATLLARFTDASLPFWDSLASALSVAAQVLLMWKIFENWALWIAVDVLSIGIYLYKGAYVTTVLYAIFLGLAVSGFIVWRRALARGETV